MSIFVQFLLGKQIQGTPALTWIFVTISFKTGGHTKVRDGDIAFQKNGSTHSGHVHCCGPKNMRCVSFQKQLSGVLGQTKDLQNA